MSNLYKSEGFHPTEAELNRENAESLGKGIMEGEVNTIVVTVLGKNGKTKQLDMAEKVFTKETDSAFRKEKVLETLSKHAKLKRLGIPTIPTMRTNPDEPDRVYMTDLTQKGTIDVFSMPDYIDGGKYEDGTKTFTVSNVPELLQQIQDLYFLCRAKNVGIENYDAFFILVDKETHKAKVIIGDLGYVGFGNQKGYGTQQQFRILLDSLPYYLDNGNEIPDRIADRLIPNLDVNKK